MQILHPDRSHFRKTWFLELDSPVSEEQLREALDFAAQEDEALRAAVVYHDVAVVQQVITDRRIPLEMLSADQFGSGEMGRLRSQISEEPADLQRESLIRAFGIRANKRNFLCVTAHSIALDDQRLRACLARATGVLEKHWPDDVSIRDWHALLSEAGLSVASLHADLGSLEREGGAVAEEAKSFGTDKIVITGMYRFDYGDESNVRELAKRLNAAGEKLKQQGIDLLYHNHNGMDAYTLHHRRGLHVTLLVALYHMQVAHIASHNTKRTCTDFSA
jgi:hypothetical protein